MLVCMSEGELADEELTKLMEELANPNIKRAVSAGLGKIVPTATQRKRASDTLKSKGNAGLALIADDSFVRGILTVLSWLGVTNLKSFPWADARGALRAVGVPPSDIEDCYLALVELRREVEREAARA